MTLEYTNITEQQLINAAKALLLEFDKTLAADEQPSELDISLLVEWLKDNLLITVND